VGLTALATAATLVLAACGGSSSTTTSSTAETAATAGSGESTTAEGTAAGGTGSTGDASTITYAAEQEWYAYNTGTTAGNATANQTVLNQVLRGFSYVDNKLELQRDTDFGSFEKVSDSPLTVKYTFNDKAVWSDGTPIDCADFLLGWASGSGRYNKDGTVNQPNAIPAEPAFLFDTATTSGLDQTQKPTCADGDKSVTLVYDTPFVDWQLAIATSAGASLVPAHVVAKQAGTDTAGLIKAIETDDAATLAKIAEFWNNGWTFDKAKGLPDASLIPSSGPFYVAAWDPGQSVTLKKNDKWWGTPAKADTVVLRFISQDQQVSALSSGEVDVIEPQPNPDSNAALTALGDTVKAEFGPLATYEHMDLSVKNAFANEKLREALFKCAPRQQIVDNLVVPSNPDAVLLNSLMLLNFQPGYDEVAEASGFKAYAEPDIEGAKAAYAASGEAAGKTIRVIHLDPNPRRTNEVALLKANCDPVGFNIQDTPLASDAFGATRAAGDYDIALFAWAGSGLLGSIAAQYLSNGPQNTAGWNDPAIDTALNTLNTSTDPAAAQALLTTVDQGLASNYFSFPIFTFPGAVATRSNITGPVLNAGQTQATWNMQDWARTG
jgi:peptide/nickel transport system substrate-binding protein